MPLDSERWADLRTAYGDGREVPDLLRRVATEGVPEGYTSVQSGCPWARLWATICHQGSVYTASYAAVPHLVHLCARVALAVRPRVINLVVSIEIGRGPSAAPLPDDLAADYNGALAELREVVAECARHPWGAKEACSLAAALLVLNGRPGFRGVELSGLGWYVLEAPAHYPGCATCGEPVFGPCGRAEPDAAADGGGR